MEITALTILWICSFASGAVLLTITLISCLCNGCKCRRFCKYIIGFLAIAFLVTGSLALFYDLNEDYAPAFIKSLKETKLADKKE